jgi:hypothetical protein
MEFFRKLFGGGQQGHDRAGMYFYIRPTGCPEIVRVRIDRNNDLSLSDDNSTYFVTKSVRGSSYKCNRAAELNLTFGSNRQLATTEIVGGEQVTEAEYETWLAEQGAGESA